MSTQETYPNVYLYRRIVQAKLFIDNNFSNSLDVNLVADEACFSKFHFIRLFKKLYGKTPHQYLIAVRIDRARQFLHEGKTVADACFGVGFESLGSFSVLFKKLVGSSPSIYLNLHSLKQMQMTETPRKFIPGCFANRQSWVEQ